ncbi:hypothetical protein [Galactobacter valiniphilus]|uniref:hypothetical protein n=1 Tax=Galactobacter valiniphilus TaxID=2676122 RepID=UPI003736CF3D
MFFDLLRFLLWPANVSDGAPNHAELEAAHAAWAGVAVSFLALVGTLVAAIYAAKAFAAQQRSLDEQRRALQAEMRARRLERQAAAAGSANGVAITIAKSSDALEHLLSTKVAADPHVMTEFLLKNGSGGWLRELTYCNPDIRALVTMLDTEHTYEPGEKHEIAPLAPGGEVKVVFKGFVDHYRSQAIAAHGPSFTWSDLDGNVWQCSQRHGVELKQSGPDRFAV